jgi:hypothetical protein
MESDSYVRACAVIETKSFFLPLDRNTVYGRGVALTEKNLVFSSDLSHIKLLSEGLTDKAGNLMINLYTMITYCKKDAFVIPEL